MTDVVLRCEGLDVHYGPVQILFDVHLDVRRGEILALLGTNGAGKSTLLRAITGLTPPRRGTVVLNGENVTGIDPTHVADRGVAMMPGGRSIFPGLSVRENLRLAAWPYRRETARVDEAMERAIEPFPPLRPRLEDRAGLLSGGEQQMVGLAKTLMQSPTLLLVDELSLGLAPIVVSRLVEIVVGLRETGTTIVLVEQSVGIALSVADRAVFMEKGQVRFTGPTSDMLERPDLLRSVFIGGGRSMAREDVRPVRLGVRPVLCARDLAVHFGGVAAVDGVDLDISPEEIVGVIGPNGAGKTTLLDLLSGFVRPERGSVELHGDDVTSLSPERRAELGVARTFQDARLFAGLTVSETIAVALERFTASREPIAAAAGLPASRVSERHVHKRVDELVRLLGLGDYRDKFVSQLSTGTRRIVELASLLAQEADVLLLDEPSAGIAQRESEALGTLLRRVRDFSGASMVIVEHDVPLLLDCCDRMVAMELGRVIADGLPGEVVRHPAVVESYLGDAASAKPVQQAVDRPRALPRRQRSV